MLCRTGNFVIFGTNLGWRVFVTTRFRYAKSSFLVVTGATPFVPAAPGLDKVKYFTSSTAFELRELPSSMVIIGGRYIALELAQMFQRMGT